MQKISYVIPCYRSQHTVGDVVAEITATMQTMPQYDYEVILVNDCSPDDTIGAIRALVAADAHVTGVDLAKNFGQHAALMAGFHKCSGAPSGGARSGCRTGPGPAGCGGWVCSPPAAAADF